MRKGLGLFALVVFAAAPAMAWEHCGGDRGGMRFSPLARITPANVCAPMSADDARGMVFLPTSSPSPDFWGGRRPVNNERANSVVALRDYDLPAQPTWRASIPGRACATS